MHNSYPLRITIFSIFLFLTFFGSAQITIDTNPGDDNADCQNNVDVLQHPDYLTWLANNGSGSASSACGNVNVPWTVVNVSVEIQEGCFGGYIFVDWEITDDCNSSPEYASSYFYIYTEYPEFVNQPQNLQLDCGDPNNTTLLNNWLASNGGATATDDCSPNLTITNNYGGSLPSCGDNEYIEFQVTDDCNNEGDHADASIEMLETRIGFDYYYYAYDESIGAVDICFEISDANLDGSCDVDVELQSYSTASNGVDYQMVNIVETYTIPPTLKDNEHCVSFNIIDDVDIESDENIYFHIIGATSTLDEVNESYFTESTLNIRILDNDDYDNDNVENSIDNCPNHHNPFQEDLDSDGIGDPCDTNHVVTQLHEVQDNIYLGTPYTGIIMKDLKNKCWMLVVQEDGNIKTIAVNCP